MEKITDTEIIESHLPQFRDRAAIEIKIIDKLIECAEASNYKLEVWTSNGEYAETDTYDVKTALFDLVNATIYVFDRTAINGENFDIGWISLIFGNGLGLVCDYTKSLQDFLRPVHELVKSL